MKTNPRSRPPLRSPLAAVLLLAACAAPPKDGAVGVAYFAGWWRELPNKYVVRGRDWRGDFPGRVATLGEYNGQDTMDREIDAAADHGVDFFQILWYPPIPGRDNPEERHLNDGLRHFLASPRNRRLRFAIEYVNHAPFELRDDAAWDEACRGWAAALAHPSCLRAGGRPVFKIHSVHHFLEECGRDPARAAARIARLKAEVRDAAGAEPLVGGGVGATGVPPPGPVAAFDFLATYMDVPALPPRAEPYPYGDLLALAEGAWTAHAQDGPKPYVPYLPAGWDPRPWGDPRPSFAFPTRTEWRDALRRVRAALDAHPNLGLPAGDGRRFKVFVIYAWNEFGEGGIVAPTRGEGAMKLEAIRGVTTESREK